jgi:hypothetical protein
MQQHTTDELDRVRNERLPRLYKLGGYTGSYVKPVASGSPGLVIQYHPLTPEIARQVEELFDGYPVEVVDCPVASAFPIRKTP